MIMVEEVVVGPAGGMLVIPVQQFAYQIDYMYKLVVVELVDPLPLQQELAATARIRIFY
jgi:hypothetical protein